MSISDGLGPSIFYRKMEKGLPSHMRGEVDEKLFISRHSRHSNFDAVVMLVLFPISTLTWCVKSMFCQEKCSNRRNEKRKHNCCYLLYYNKNQSF